MKDMRNKNKNNYLDTKTRIHKKLNKITEEYKFKRHKLRENIIHAH